MRFVFVLAVLATSLTYVSAKPLDDDSNSRPQADISKPLYTYELDNHVIKEANKDDLFSYDPLDSRPWKTISETSSRKKKLQPALNQERESSTTENRQKKGQLNVAASMADELPDGSPNVDMFSSIAHNSREVRLVGPNQREVEMKDDIASKVVVALDNLSKEATDVWEQVNDKLDKGWKEIKTSEVWGQVNDKLDKGWTDLKTMVEGVVSSSPSSSSSSRKTISP